MTKVIVTFQIEGDDPQDSTGVSEEQFNEITDALIQLGGDNIEFEKAA